MSFDAQEKSQRGGSPVEIYRFTHGSSEWRYTSADDATLGPGSLVYDNVSISRGEIDSSDEDQQGMLEVTVLLDNPVAQLFIGGIPVAPVRLTVYRRHRGDSEVIQLWSGEVSSIQFTGVTAVLSCQPVGNILRRQVPSVNYGAQCNWALYSTGCGVALATYAESSTVTAIAGNDVTVTIGHDRAAGYFNNGFVILASTGERHWIVNHVRLSSTSAKLTLMTPFASIAVGTVLTSYPGCDRTLDACSSKFSNLARFLGFPYLPAKNPFESGVV